MAVPYTFSTATGSLPLSQLDSNFATGITIGNTSVVLGDTITTINNLALANVAITSVSTAFPNGYLANSNVIVGTTTLTLGSTVTAINGLSLSNVTISSGNVTISNVTTTNVTATTANVTTANVGTLVVIGDASVGGNTTVTGNITAAKGTFTSANVSGTANVQVIAVTQNATVAGNATVTGNVSAANGTFTSANVSGAANVSTLAVISNVTIGGNATVTGNVSMNVATITTANVSGTANVSTLVVTANQTSLGNISVTGNVTASSFTSTSTFGFKNRIINGAMVIDQRNAGASLTATTGNLYSVDRWQTLATVSSKFTAQQNAASVTPPAGFVNYLGITSSAATTVAATDYYILQQSIEGYNLADLNWGSANAQTVTLSFWVRSSLTGSFGVTLQNGGNTRSYPILYTISVANTWEYKTITIAGDTSGTWLTTNGNGVQIRFDLGIGSTYRGTSGAWTGTSNIYGVTGATNVVGTNGATFYITGVQLEKGSTATSFDYRPYGTELALCQRYYYQMSGSANQDILIGSAADQTTWIRYSFPLPVIMRGTPSLVSGAGSTYRNLLAGGSIVPTNIALDPSSSTNVTVNLYSSSITTGMAGVFRFSSSLYLGFSAEL
jgi:hypothetical protein